MSARSVLHTAFEKKSVGKQRNIVSAKSREAKNTGEGETGAAIASRGRGTVTNLQTRKLTLSESRNSLATMVQRAPDKAQSR
jgi:hypothetical protein